MKRRTSSLNRNSRHHRNKRKRAHSLCLYLAALLPFLVGSAGCQRKTSVAAPASLATAPPALDVRDRPGLMFTYLDEKGELHSTEKLSAVPLERRAGVRVIDLNVAPDERGAGRYIYVADLRQPSADGAYPYQILSPISYDRAVSTAPIQHRVDEAMKTAGEHITLYSTSWCGVCAKARSFFKKKGIDYVDRDIEKDEGAQVELQEKARRAGVVPQGVPVIDVYGEIMLGFDESHLDDLIEKHGSVHGGASHSIQ